MADIRETLESLGVTKEAVIDRVVDGIVERLLADDGVFDAEIGSMTARVNALIENAINERVRKIGDDKILPQVDNLVEGLVLQKTNQWGEKVGHPVTFVEYMTQRADAYMREEVNHDGKTKDQDSYSWRKYGTRVAFMVDKHLHYSIHVAMEKALKDVNSSIAKGLAGAVAIAIENEVGKLKGQKP